MTPELINLPSRVEIRQGWHHVVLRGDDSAQVTDALDRLDSQAVIRRIELRCDSGFREFLKAVKPPVRVLVTVSSDSIGNLHSVDRESWEGQGVNLWAVPDGSAGQDAVALVKTATDAGFPVLLKIEEDFLRKPLPLLHVLDHYLFHPELNVPIDPFHSMLVTKVQLNRRNLWRYSFGHPFDYFYLDGDGNVSLCKNWVSDPTRRFGTADQPVEAWRQSEAHGLLTEWLKEPQGTDPDCVDCRHVPFCRGMLQCLDGQADCEGWLEIMDRIRLAAGVLQKGAPQDQPRRGRPADRRPAAPEGGKDEAGRRKKDDWAEQP
jgi:radical SAM protein with 4Fe4S-binding SPASM domain